MTIDHKSVQQNQNTKMKQNVIEKKKFDQAQEVANRKMKQKKKYEKYRNKIQEASNKLKILNRDTVFIPVGNGVKRNRNSLAEILRDTEARAAKLSAERKAKAARDALCDQADSLRFALEGGWDI